MLIYNELNINPETFLLLISLIPNEFKCLLLDFEKVYLKKYPRSKTKTGKV